MLDLKTTAAHSYGEHPAFRFDTTSWKLSVDHLAAFNDTYDVAREMGSVLSRTSYAAIRRDCLHALDVVFTSLREQGADEFEGFFLRELRSGCIRLLNEELAWYARQPQSRFIDLKNQKSRQDAVQLQTARYYFGRLPQSAVDELRGLASVELIHFKANVSAGKLRREDLSINSGPTVRALRNVLDREFKLLGALDAASALTGRKTRVIGLALELSVPQATWWSNAIEGLARPPRTLYAHLDETISCPKSIVYLTDVTEKNGPTGCYPGAYEAMNLNPLQEIIGRVVGSVGSSPGSPLRDYYAKQYHQSMNSEKFRRHFMRLPQALRFNSHIGWDVAPGSELESSLADNELKMTGPAGTFIVFDGARLLHRGGLMQQGERLALQVIFSDMTFAQRVLGKVKRMFS